MVAVSISYLNPKSNTFMALCKSGSLFVSFSLWVSIQSFLNLFVSLFSVSLDSLFLSLLDFAQEQGICRSILSYLFFLSRTCLLSVSLVMSLLFSLNKFLATGGKPTANLSVDCGDRVYHTKLRSLQEQEGRPLYNLFRNLFSISLCNYS